MCSSDLGGTCNRAHSGVHVGAGEVLDLDLGDLLKLGSGRPHLEKVGKITRAQLEEIAKIKIKDLTGADMDAAVRTIAGSARSIGIRPRGPRI